MPSPLILAWALGFVMLPGLALDRRFLGAASRASLPERLARACVVGSVTVSVIGFVLWELFLFSGWWAAVLAVTVAASPLAALRSLRARKGGSFWLLAGAVVALELAMVRGTPEFGFGQDVYFWSAMARQVALGGAGVRIPSWTSPAPAGYGFVMATAADFVPDLHHNPAIVFFVVFWSLFAACGGYALASSLAGRKAGAVATLVYLGGYWSLYFLVPAVSRQGWALGIAPLVLLTLVRKGHRAFRSRDLYVFLGAAWWMHALTALLLLCCLVPVAFEGLRKLGPRALVRELGLLGTLGALALLAPPLALLGRFGLAIAGILSFDEHPLHYVMRPMDPAQLAKTLGAATLVLLALGAISLRRGFAGARGRARLLGLSLILGLAAIGLFPQLWYRSAFVALPPERYYLFYGLAALCWAGALRPPRGWSDQLQRGVLASSAALALAQLGFDATFARRMLHPSDLNEPALAAARWIDGGAALDVQVIVALDADRAAMVRNLLAPRPVVLLDPAQDFRDAALGSATYLVTDRSPLPAGRPVRFVSGSPPLAVVELHPEPARPQAVLIFDALVSQACPVCRSTSPREFARRERVPVHQNLPFPTPEEARQDARGTLALHVCPDCGFVYNAAFEPERVRYGPQYDNTQECSPTFSRYTDELVRHLVEDLGVRRQRVVEVGCGKGAFLRKLVATPGAENLGYGFDPSYEGPETDLDGRLVFHRRFFDETAGVEADVVVCRHVIEHVARPLDLLASVRRALGGSPRARVFFETPEVAWTLTHRVFWDFFYEHCSLFTADSLRTAFESASFEVESVKHVFGDQYLWLEARPGDSRPPSRAPGAVEALALDYGDVESRLVASWRGTIEALAREGRVAIWGAGAKGSTFAHLVDPDATRVDSIVDLNPAKQGRYLPGTGHPIVSYRDLPGRGVAHAVLMNPNYRDENVALLAEEHIDVSLVEEPRG